MAKQGRRTQHSCNGWHKVSRENPAKTAPDSLNPRLAKKRPIEMMRITENIAMDTDLGKSESASTRGERKKGSTDAMRADPASIVQLEAVQREKDFFWSQSNSGRQS